jgi:hypothetical protein
MATTIDASFKGLRSNLEITGLQKSTVSTRQTSVRDAVGRHLSVLDSFVTGSYKRHTMIAPLEQADIDIMVILDAKYYVLHGHAALLDRTRRVLLKTYTKTPKISRNGQAVTINFSDFVVDVVPGFRRSGGGFLIPNSTERRWIETNPKVHETFLSTANAAHNGSLVPLVKMIKAWNRAAGRPLRSFYLELLVQSVLHNVTVSDDPSGCRYVFDHAREKVRYTLPDPSGLAKTGVSGLQGVTVQQAIGRLQLAYNRAISAERLAGRGRIADAVEEWRKIFGNAFPAQGFGR